MPDKLPPFVVLPLLVVSAGALGSTQGYSSSIKEIGKMNSPVCHQLPGLPLTDHDYEKLATSGIAREVAEIALLRRVTSVEGRELVGGNANRNYAGLVFPYVWPGDGQAREYRLRRDEPDLERRPDGTIREKAKYLSPPGSGNKLYFVPGTPPELLEDPTVPIVITEGEKKTLALWALGHPGLPKGHLSRCLPIGLAGVWNWRGTVGKAPGPNGDRRDVKGVIPDFDRIEWRGRRAVIIFDANVRTNPDVSLARRLLARELAGRGAQVFVVDLPDLPGVNGIDDLVGQWGPEKTLDHLHTAVRPAATTSQNLRALVPTLADAISASDRFARDAGGRLYRYSGGVYRPDGAEHVKGRVKELTALWDKRERWSSHRAREVIEYITVDAPRLWARPPLDTLNLQNGLLDLRTRTLRPHSPEWLSPLQLPVRFDPEARCPHWDHFAVATFPEDAACLAFEIPALLMLPDTSFQKAILLTGEGSNGKSAYLAGVVAFLGPEHVSAVSLHRLEQDRFSVARLVGKLANICADLPSGHLETTSTFKALTGGDTMVAERKHENSFDFVPYARLVFSANHLPRSKDASPAFFRRWLVIPFARTFEGENAIPRDELDRRLADPSELSGVLNRALDALEYLRTDGLTETESLRRAREEFRAATDPFQVWLDAATVNDPAAFVPMSDLLRAYARACDRDGRPALGRTAFGLALRRARPSVVEGQRTIDGRRQWVYCRIGLVEHES